MRPFAAVFPGQGAQQPGMGRSLHDTFPESRAAFEEADAALGHSISRDCFEGDESVLASTETTQPALLTVAVAALRAMQARGARPSWAAGHSLGEYAGHVAAESIAFADAVRTVRSRGRFMQEAVPVGEGAMAAVLGLDSEAVSRLCEAAAEGRVVSPANFNAPGQIVIAGHADAVSRASLAAVAAGARRVVPLPVSAPFHCALMEPAARRLRDVLDAIPLADLRVPVYCNVDALPIQTATAAKDSLVAQVASPVRWHDEVIRMSADGVRTFVEMGPGRVLSGLIRRIVPSAEVLAVSDAGSADAVLRTLEAAA